MEKLIELLNEYEKSGLNEFEKYNNAGIVEWIEHTKGNLYWRYWGNSWSYMVVISKEYGFINWLVENDKIDRTFRANVRYPYYLEKEGLLQGYEKSDVIIMLLSIQDNPLDFLVKILK